MNSSSAFKLIEGKKGGVSNCKESWEVGRRKRRAEKTNVVRVVSL